MDVEKILAGGILAGSLGVLAYSILPKAESARLVGLETVRSREITITVLEAGEPALLFNVDKWEGYVGETFTFYGWLERVYDEEATEPIPNVTVRLYINGNLVGSAVTGSNGYYEIKWTPTAAGTYTCYAEAEV